jgi:hypothetical protein
MRAQSKDVSGKKRAGTTPHVEIRKEGRKEIYYTAWSTHERRKAESIPMSRAKLLEIIISRLE